jgi:hypothetical protein
MSELEIRDDTSTTLRGGRKLGFILIGEKVQLLVKAICLQLSGRYVFGHYLEEPLVSQRVVYLFVLGRILL